MKKILITTILSFFILFTPVTISDGLDPLYKIKGYALYFNNGSFVPSGTITAIIKETGEKNFSNFVGGYWEVNLTSTLNNSQNKFSIGLIINTSDEKRGYNKLTVGVGSFATQTQKCSTKRWHFQGYAVDSSSGNYINQGNITVGIDGISGTNTTGFSNGMWDIYYSPCLISGKIYTFKFIITSEDKRNYMFLNQVAK